MLFTSTYSALLSCTSSSIPTYQSEWFTIHHSERSMWQLAHISSDNLRLPYTSELEVMWDQATFDLLEQTLQHPLWFCIHSGWPSEDKFIILTMERNHTDRTDRTNITWLARTCRKGSIHNSCNVHPSDQKTLIDSVARAINESLWVVLKTWTAMMTGLSSRWIS